MRIKHVVTALLLLAVPAVGLAIALDTNNDVTSRIPEPETLALLAVGALAWGIARWKNRK
jgi:4-hydroxybenzoate polyprenyltransferase